MNNIKQYNNVRIEIESRFTGLRHTHIAMISWLITRASSETGVVENITHSDLASLLTVNAAPGRKDSGTPQKQTIRSYLRTIQSQCGDHFKIISDGQSLKIQFPTLPAIYASHFESTEVYTEKNTVPYTPRTLINTAKNASNDDEVNTEEYTDLYTDESAHVINVYANNKQTKTNKNTQTDVVLESFSQPVKHTIADDFYPNEAIINHALNKGLTKVLDDSEIKKFISYNQTIASTRVDHSPLFLRWLERDAEHTEKLNQTAQLKQPARSLQDECRGHWINSSETTPRDAHGEHGNIVLTGEFIDGHGFGTDFNQKHRVALDAINQPVRQTIPYQTRCPR